MAKIIFNFAGTGSNGEDCADDMESFEHSTYDKDVIRVYIAGCQDPNVGGSGIFPDLNIVANKIKKAFDETGQLDMDLLKEELGSGCFRIVPGKTKGKIAIESIGLQGFSRGGVTTFAVGKALDSLGIPIDIIANQPVPGGVDSLIEGTGIYKEFGDLSQCKNIRSATTFLVSQNNENGIAMNTFFQQMIAKFPSTTKVNNWLMPFQHHTEWFKSKLIFNHIEKLFVGSGYSKSTLAQKSELNSEIKQHYDNSSTLYFTPKGSLLSQKIFGENSSIVMDPVYTDQIKDKAYDILKSLKINYASSLIKSQEQNEDNAQESVKKTEIARAIVALSQIGLTTEEQEKLTLFIIGRAPGAEKLVDVINKAHDTCGYIANTEEKIITKKIKANKVSTEVSDKKLNNIEEFEDNAKEFQKTVCLESYEYLTTQKPTMADKTSYVDSIAKAARKFYHETAELSENPSGVRELLKFMVVAVVKLTGLPLISNSINRALETGTIFHTRASQITYQTTEDIMKSVTKDNQKTLKNSIVLERKKQEQNNEHERGEITNQDTKFNLN